MKWAPCVRHITLKLQGLAVFLLIPAYTWMTNLSVNFLMLKRR